MVIMCRHTLLLLIILCFFSNTHGELDFEATAETRMGAENQLETLMLELKTLKIEVNNVKSVLRAAMTKLQNAKLELKECVKKDQLPTFVRNITSSTPNEQIDDIRNTSHQSSAETPVVPGVNIPAIDQILKPFVQPSCYHWLQSGFTSTGVYSIDPDGHGVGNAPFPVFCNMSTGETYIKHNKEGIQEAAACSGPMCHTTTFNYTATGSQIRSLIIISDMCKQFIKVDCLESPFGNKVGALAWWRGADGMRHYEWAEEDYSNLTCSCSCRESCNCDSDLLDFWVYDGGYVTNKSELPVHEVTFGTKDLHTPLQMKYTIGPLQCYGSHGLSYPTSCEDLLFRGAIYSGWYVLGEPHYLRFTYCNVEKPYAEQDSINQPVDIDLGDFLLRNLQSKGYTVLRNEQLNEIIRNAKEQQHNFIRMEDLVRNNKDHLLDLSLHLVTFQSNNTESIAELKRNLTRTEHLAKNNEGHLRTHSFRLDTLNSNVENVAELNFSLTLTKNLAELNDNRLRILPDVLEPHLSTLYSLEKIVKAPSNTVAYCAGLWNNWGTEGIVKYDWVRVNHGNGYNSDTGTFTAPVDGLYYIGAYARQENYDNTWYQIRVNGVDAGQAAGYGVYGASMGIANLVHLQIGDRVHVELGGGQLETAGGSTSFFGFLVHKT